jgi:hypothetical protein
MIEGHAETNRSRDIKGNIGVCREYRKIWGIRIISG